MRWHRPGLRLYWKHNSRGKAGRPRLPGEVRALIREIGSANPLWGAPRIHGERLKGYVARAVGATRESIRRDLREPVIVMGEAHLRRRLRAYADYGNSYRTHRGLNKDTPLGRPVQRRGRITSMPKLGGLHHAYVRI